MLTDGADTNGDRRQVANVAVHIFFGMIQAELILIKFDEEHSRIDNKSV